MFFKDFFFKLCPTACGILVPQAGMGPMTPTVEVQSLKPDLKKVVDSIK